jgi:hypothetical protein
MKGLKPSEAHKLIEDGKALEYQTPKNRDWSFFYKAGVNEIAQLINESGWIFREKQEEAETVEIFGKIYSGGCVFTDLYPFRNTHKITFKTDEEGKPICDSIKLEEL